MKDNNIHESQYHDNFLKLKLNENSYIEKAPEDFTNKTMDKVMQEWIANPITEKKNNHSTRYWLILFTTISMAALIYLATDLRKLINMSDINWLKSLDSTYLTQLSNTYNSLINTLTSITPLFYIILFAVIAIVIADKIIKRIPRYSNVYIF